MQGFTFSKHSYRGKVMKIILTVLTLVLLFAPVQAELTPTSIDISGPSYVHNGDWVKITGVLEKNDQTPIYDNDLVLIEVDVYVNDGTGSGWVKRINPLYPDENGKMFVLFKIRSDEDVQVKFHMKDHCSWTSWIGGIESWGGLQECRSHVHKINVGTPIPASSQEPIKLISYGKGFFMLAFFGSLFATMCMGFYSVAANEPQKKADSQTSFFSLLQVLLTVTIFYGAAIYFAP